MKPEDLDELLVRADMLEEKGDTEGARLLRQLIGEARLPSLRLGSWVEFDVHGKRVPATMRRVEVGAGRNAAAGLWEVAITAEFRG